MRVNGAKLTGYSYLFITEDWFNTNYDEELLMNCNFDERLKARMLKLLNCFKHGGDTNED